MNQIAISKLNGIVNNGRMLAMQGMEALQREYGLRNDFVVKANAVDADFVEVAGNPKAQTLQLKVEGKGYGLTQHSRSQLLDRAGIPGGFADKLDNLGAEGKAVLLDNIRRLVPLVSAEGVLVREVSGTAKGILSPSYRRLDASPLFESYAAQSLKMGLVPYTGQVTDTRAFLSFISTDILEPIPGEYLVVGTELRTSDYGRGAFQLALSVLRLLCTNGLVGNDILRKVHLGRRFDASEYQGSVVMLSKRTMELDAATVQSAMTDIFRTIPERQKELVASIQNAAKGELKLGAALDGLRKKLPKAIVDEAKALYENAALPVEAVPQEPGKWRFAQTLSLLANGQKDADVATDLRDFAFQALAA